MCPVFNMTLVHVTREMIIETSPIVAIDGKYLMIIYCVEIIRAVDYAADFPDDYMRVVQGSVNTREEKSNAGAFYNGVIR